MLGHWQRANANVHLLFPCSEMCQNATGKPQKSSLIHSTVMVAFHVPGTVFSARGITALLQRASRRASPSLFDSCTSNLVITQGSLQIIFASFQQHFLVAHPSPPDLKVLEDLSTQDIFFSLFLLSPEGFHLVSWLSTPSVCQTLRCLSSTQTMQ